VENFICDKLTIYDNSKVLVDIEFEIEHSLALIGQSGSGKSLTLKAILGLLPSNLVGDFKYTYPYKIIRGQNISFVPQNPFTALSPLTLIKDQFFIDDEKIDYYLELVGLDSSLKNSYPPHLSGGQLQRVVIAIAISTDSKIILFDEPTTALDTANIDIILSLINSLSDKLSFLTLFVTHDISVAKKIAKNVAIIKSGKIIEKGNTIEVLNNPKNNYTKELIESSFRSREFRK
jgi:peptide/nickel transport system ATP-binding protein